MNSYKDTVFSVLNYVKNKLTEKPSNDFHEPIVTVGRHTYGLENIRTSWGSGAEVVIGSFTSIASNLHLHLGGNHNVRWISTYPFGHVFKDGKVPFSPPVAGHPAPVKSIFIGSDVWIGNNVTIMGGIRIGDGAVIAMNSHVVSNVDAYEIHGGNPARKIRDRFPLEITKALQELRWWEADDEIIEKIKHLLAQEPTLSSIQEVRSILSTQTENWEAKD
jgi:acetyltransferase-like isoleucine patch superfamily enzyme